MKKALIVIDMQIMPFVWKDYGGKPLSNEQELIEHTKNLLTKARRANAPVFYILYTEKGDSPRAENQPLWQVHPEVAPYENDIQIIKYHADSFLNTDLEKELRNRGITNLVFCGVQTEYCVDATVKSAYSLGFTCELASDVHSTYDYENLSAEQIIIHHNHILSTLSAVCEESQINF
ncbi:cysteine hydrolase family protein [Paenibacillus sp. GCM10028914]|uniref:cysteine hydrolase family protein n=1 Tax=Paenibacillus sp. GCM10028914 TaxID=3273416 RepID=UPI003607EB4E